MWFSVKCLFIHRNLSKEAEKDLFEERIILTRAKNNSWAIKKAELEARHYAKIENCEYLRYCDCFKIENSVGDNSEIYSLMRSSALEPEDYISRFYDTGNETSQRNEEYDYGIDADITAIGPYRKDIADYLEYPKEFYKKTKFGTIVIVNSVFYSAGKKKSRILAECFNITEIWDFNQHEINPDNVNVFKLKNEFDINDVKQYTILRDAEFKFYFQVYDNEKLGGK
jgi:hypothetical protein